MAGKLRGDDAEHGKNADGKNPAPALLVARTQAAQQTEAKPSCRQAVIGERFLRQVAQHGHDAAGFVDVRQP